MRHVLLTDEAWADIRRRYERGDETVEAICLDHGISSGTLQDRIRRWNWTRRGASVPRTGPRPPALPPSAPAFAPSRDDAPGVGATACETALPVAEGPPTPERVAAAVARVLGGIEALVARLAASSLQTAEMERAGRALASLTRTLRELNALAAQYPVPNLDDDRGPDDPNEFILEVARRLDAFAAAGATREAAETQGEQP